MNIQKMLKQAQQMQAKVQAAQSELEAEEAQGSAGGGSVKLSLSGKYDLKSLNIDSSIIDADDKEMLEDLIIAAYNDAKQKVDVLTKSKMDDATGGMKLPF